MRGGPLPAASGPRAVSEALGVGAWEALGVRLVERQALDALRVRAAGSRTLGPCLLRVPAPPGCTRTCVLCLALRECACLWLSVPPSVSPRVGVSNCLFARLSCAAGLW